MTDKDRIEVRRYGQTGPEVVVLHGGPAAPGSAEPIARGLADAFTAFEPLQRGSGDGPVSVARHVADLRDVIEYCCRTPQPALVGWSWGAMLALAYAAEFPKAAGPIVLVGCGTFDPAARAQMRQILRDRTTGQMQAELDRIEATDLPPLKKMANKYAVMSFRYDYEPLEEPDAPNALATFDAEAHTQTWDDMLRCQADGLYPQAFAAIRSPVLMLHGDYDPHPGPATLATLRAHIPQIEYRELARCGHSPWKERYAREDFFDAVQQWLLSRLDGCD